MRVANAFYYPDVLVTCERTDTEPYYKTQPILIAEVLSPSTLERDTLGKRVAYQTLPSLQEYVQLEQDRMEIRVYRRTAEGWDLERFEARDVVRLSSVGLDIPIETLYEDVWR